MQGVASVVAALFDEYRRQGEEAIRRARVAELREIIGRAFTKPSPLALPFRPIQVPPVMPDPYVPPPARARPLPLEDRPSPQRRGREEEMPEAKAPKAKQRVITEQEIMSVAKEKGVPVRQLPSAQPYLAPLPQITAPEILATQTAKAAPKAQYMFGYSNLEGLI